MPARVTEVLPTPESIAAYVTKNAGEGMASMQGMHHGPLETVREDDYQGRHITVRTTYEIDVDGKPVTGHIDVSNDGQVAYHGLPNMSFDSAIDLVKRLIDHFPEDFQKGSRPARKSKGAMSGMAGMSGMKRKASSKKASRSRKS
jgi:hypothetical protein